MAEDFAGEKEVPFWMFEATLSSVVATLNNHHLFEFFVVARDLSWLVGENHHDVWFGAGEHAVEVLDGIKN